MSSNGDEYVDEPLSSVLNSSKAASKAASCCGLSSRKWHFILGAMVVSTIAMGVGAVLYVKEVLVLPGIDNLIAGASGTESSFQSLSPSMAPISPPSSKPSSSPSSIPSLRPSNGPSEIPSEPPSALPSASDGSLFSFYVLGDAPYSERAIPNFRKEMRALQTTYESDAAKFVVHVGDMQKGKVSLCKEKFYTSVRDIFIAESPLPTLALAGDNDWNDCPDPEQAWKYYESHFIGLERNWTSHQELGIQRWYGRRPENFVLSIDGVLILSVNLVNEPILDRQEWKERTSDNIEWTKNCVNNYLNNTDENVELRAVILLGHAVPRNNNMDYFKGIRSIFFDANTNLYKEGLDIPLLYIHGDGHNFKIRDMSIGNWKNFHAIEVDEGSSAPPIKVEVDTKHSNLTELNSLQYVLGNGLIRIDRRGGRRNS